MLHPSYTCCSHQKGKCAKHGNLTKSNSLSQVEEHLTEQKFHLVFKQLIRSIGSYINDSGDLDIDTDRRAVGAASLPPGQVQTFALLKKFLLVYSHLLFIQRQQ